MGKTMATNEFDDDFCILCVDICADRWHMNEKSCLFNLNSTFWIPFYTHIVRFFMRSLCALPCIWVRSVCCFICCTFFRSFTVAYSNLLTNWEKKNLICVKLSLFIFILCILFLCTRHLTRGYYTYTTLHIVWLKRMECVNYIAAAGAADHGVHTHWTPLQKIKYKTENIIIKKIY